MGAGVAKVSCVGRRGGRGRVRRILFVTLEIYGRPEAKRICASSRKTSFPSHVHDLKKNTYRHFEEKKVWFMVLTVSKTERRATAPAAAPKATIVEEDCGMRRGPPREVRMLDPLTTVERVRFSRSKMLFRV